MAGCGYHSPQFSEDLTWLPAWLQPHQLPHFGEHANDEHAIVACKNQAYFQENISSGQAGQDAKYSSFHLYLSGEDNSPVGNTPSSGQELHFRLHLSSLGVSQLSSGQLNEMPRIGRCETNLDSCRNPLETPPVQDGTSCRYKLDNDAPVSESPIGCSPRMSHIDKAGQNNQQGKLNDSNLKSAEIDVETLQTEKGDREGSSREPIPDAPAVQNNRSYKYKVDSRTLESNMPPVGCKPRMSHIPVSESHDKADQNDWQRCQGKLDAGNLRTADLNDAVELSIAASEAMVISEMASGISLSKLLPSATIIEIALRVKHARKQCYSDISETVSVFSNDELDETDQLSNLDEDIMEEAFDDVGLSVTQIVGTPENSFCDGKSPQQQIFHSTSSCDLNRHVSDTHCGPKEEEQKKWIKSQDVDINRTISQTYDVSSDGIFPLEALPLLQLRSTALLAVDSTTSCLRNQSIAHTQKLIQNADALTAIQMNFIEDRGILKESQVAPPRDTSIRITIKEFCNGETSFISESMDVVNECTFEQRPEVDHEIVASSSTPFKDISRCTYEANKSTYEGTVSSQDLVRSSSLSLVDPLCSIVPCSISLDDAPMKEAEENCEKFMNSATAVELQNLNGNTTMPDAQETLPAKLDQGGRFHLSKITVEGSGVPSRKEFNSLKPYSMVMPCKNTAGEDVFQKESIPLPSMGEKILHLFPNEKSSNCFAFNKYDSGLPLKATDKSVDVDQSNNNCNIRSNDHEKVDGPSAIAETKDDDIVVPVHPNEKTCSTSILNNKRFQACKTFSSSDCEDGTVKKPSALIMRKYRSEYPMNEVRCRDQTNFTSCVPQQSSLRLHPANKQSLLDKKVRFLEAKPSTGSQRRTRKRVKESSLQAKPENRKQIFNSSTSCRTMHGKGMIFQGFEFLLTGFSSLKENELEAFIRKYGGYVLSKIPSVYPDLRGKRVVESESLKLPIVLSPRKVQTTKFLYGCATNTWMLNADWLLDSAQAGFVLPPGKYMTRPIQVSGWNYLRIVEPICFDNRTFIFDRVGIMLYGKASFCTKFSKIIKHGGGQVFKSLQRLVQSLKNGKNTVGAILVENEGSVSRHLKHCAFEHNLHTMPASWIVNSLFSGKLLPFKKDRCAPLHRIKMPTFPQAEAMDMSEEI